MSKKIKTHLILALGLASLMIGCSKDNNDSYGEIGDTHGDHPAHANKASTTNEPKSIQFWWPERLDLSPLRQHGVESNPFGDKFDYPTEFAKINLDELNADITKLMSTSQDWWPADWGNYGPFMIRMAWHSTGTYRVTDGRGGAGGGQQRFEPLNSWPDNANLDKARRLLWPIKKKYGRALSWADLMVLTGNVAMESMGFKTLGFAGGRLDDWEADLVYWGPETKMLEQRLSRYHNKGKERKLHKPLGAVQMGLIYVNPEGPGANHNPADSAQDIRETFGRMAMNDEETFALIAGGHTFGKVHGAHKPADCVGPEPAAAGTEQQGLGWKNKCGDGNGKDTVTSGLEGAWTSAPTRWTHQYLTNLMGNEWEKFKSPAGATQWKPKEGSEIIGSVPDAHVKGKMNSPIMLTSDMALKVDPEYNKIAKRFLNDPKEFEKAFAKAWFKLTHRDMGPRARYVGKDAPTEAMLWQDNVPKADYKLIDSSDIANLKKKILNSGLSTSDLVKTAWASAASYRGTDMRGGANGARLRLAPQKNWEVNSPKELSKVLQKLEEIQSSFNKNIGADKQVSLADVIVLAGSAAVEKAAADAGTSVTVEFKAGRTDASQEQTDVDSFEFLNLTADGFRNYYTDKSKLSPVKMLVDRANLLTLTVPEMTVLVGGMRVLGANSESVEHGYFTDKVGTLSNDFFVNLLDMSTMWRKSSGDEKTYEGVDRKTEKLKWTATPVDLIFGSHSELRAVAEVYAADDGQKKFVKDFAEAWTKVMKLDRFDLK
jgi:catalase-peroxidase